MVKKVNQDNLSEIKDTTKESIKEEKKNSGETAHNKTLWKIILGIIIITIILVVVGLVLKPNDDTILTPKSEITLVVKDENGNAINGLRLKLIGPNHYNVDYKDIADYTILGAKAGDYLITFEIVPAGYTCETFNDNFTLTKGGKVKLEYSCSKEK